MQTLNMYFKKKLAPALVTALVTAYVGILQKTCKIEISGMEKIQPYIDAEQPMLPSYWHQQMTFSIDFIHSLCQQGVNASVLVSPSKDGDLGEAVLKKMGVGVLRGSAHRAGALVLRDIYLKISKEKCSVGAAVDGSLGPARVAKVGAITLAQLSGAPIIPIVNACSRKIHFNSWDNFFLPLPYSRVQIIIGEPIEVKKRVSAEQITLFQRQLTEQLNQLSLLAEQQLN